MPRLPNTAEVLVVGAGPAGSAAGYWCARFGLATVLADAAEFPRDKTCGDGLTPHALSELDDMGLGDWVRSHGVNRGMRAVGFGREALLDWPEGPWPPAGCVIPRMEFDAHLRDYAAAAGATCVDGVRATEVQVEAGRVSGVWFQTSHGKEFVGCKTLIVADGVRSPVGRLLGRQWHRSTAFGVSARGYMQSDCVDDSWITFDLEPRGKDGALRRGYGWKFPIGGSGLVNVGVFLLGSDRRPVGTSLRPLLDGYIDQRLDAWQLSGAIEKSASALLPMGGAVSGVDGPNWMLIGDAAGCVNPLNGEGIDYALQTGRLAAERIAAGEPCDTWSRQLNDRYGAAYSLARRIAPTVFAPRVLRRAAPHIIERPRLAARALRVMGNFAEPTARDRTARTWRAMGRLSMRFEREPLFAPHGSDA